MREPAKILITALALVALTGATANNKPMTERQRALHVLNRLAFGPRPGEVDKVMQLGVDDWIEQQLRPDSISDRGVDARLQQFATLKMSSNEIVAKYYVPVVEARREVQRAAKDDPEMSKQDEQEMRREVRAKLAPGLQPQQPFRELIAQRIIRAADSDRQLNEVMIDFWMNHFNVFSGKGIDRYLLTSFERDTIRPHIWGRFEDLLMATAKSPAMLFYLDNARSVAAPENRPQVASRRFAARRMNQDPNANAGREGLNENYARELMELHTLGVDGGYTQKDVTELARVLTGWSIPRPREGNTGFVFRSYLHDTGAKTVLGVRFPAGGGIEEGERMIRILAHHPNTAHRIAYKLCQRLVADEPPPALVDRVAKKFLDTDGDLRQTLRAVIKSPEFWDAKNYRAKVKSPFEYVVSAVRAVDADVVDPTPLARALQQMGEPLYGAQPPTGYSDKADAWVNTGALMNRLNFALALAGNKLPGVSAKLAPEASVDALAATLTGGNLTDETRNTIKARAAQGAPMAAGLILGSPEFQRQ